MTEISGSADASVYRDLVRRARIPERYADALESGRSATTVIMCGGLPLHLKDGAPVAPQQTFARHVQLVLKRALIDIPLSLLALIVLSPALLLLALLIKLTSKGPVLFSQMRVGRNNELFRMYKFRTMWLDDCVGTGVEQVTTEDRRITPLGRFMRATSLDELPQLWNVLIGNMALIGPRPMVPGMRAVGVDYHDIVPYYDYRHLVKPGLSGWAQAAGLRGPTTDAASAKARIDYDCAYVQHVSVLLDIRAIYMTIVREFVTGSGL